VTSDGNNIDDFADNQLTKFIPLKFLFVPHVMDAPGCFAQQAVDSIK